MLDTKNLEKLLSKISFTTLNYALEYFGFEKCRVKADAVKKLVQVFKKADSRFTLEFFHFLDAQNELDEIDEIYENYLIRCMSKSEVLLGVKYLLRNQFCTIDDIIDDYNKKSSNSEIVSKIEKLLEDYELDSIKQTLEDFDIHQSSFNFSTETKFKAFSTFLFGEKGSVGTIGVNSQSDVSEHNVTINYNHELLNIGQNPLDVVERLKKVNKYLQSSIDKEFRSYGLLFEGPSGVGKTEFAKYVAITLGLPLALRSYGSFSSGFNGETESRINEFFSEAKENNSIIFIDEADSMFFNREKALQDFQISIVNEMLVQIEKYPGIVICSTNLIKVLDKAVIRRFAEKIAFDYLSNVQSEYAFEVYFKKSLSEIDRSKLNRINDLSIGDFKVVRQKTFFEESITNSYLIQLLVEEVNFRKGLD